MSRKFTALIAAVCLLLAMSAFAENDYVYGTAALTYSEFYAGDVSSVEGFDAVTSATTGKAGMFANAYTDFVDAETNAAGYHILGVRNVNIAVPAAEVEAYKAINPTFETSSEVPMQYKPVSVENGQAVYGATVWNIADTVTTAQAVLLTGTNWGDYQINVTETDTAYIRNTREDNGFAVGSGIMGIIVENSDGFKAGLEYLQNIWVMPYELSFNVSSESTRNSRIAIHDNISEFAKLPGTDIVKITFITAESAYEYTFDGIYVKPAYDGNYAAVVDGNVITLDNGAFSDLSDPVMTVTYTVGEGREAKRYTLAATALTDGVTSYELDLTEISNITDPGAYSFVISSDNYADISCSIPRD